MKLGRIFWGFFLLVFGGLLMLDRLTALQIHPDLSWKLWPVLLVLWGVGLVVGGKAARTIIAAIAGAFLALLLMSAWWGDWDVERDGRAAQGAKQVFREQYSPTTTHASFLLESGAGTFRIHDTTAELLDAQTWTTAGSYHLDHTGNGKEEQLALRLDRPMRVWGLGRGENSVYVRLHPDPAWDLAFNVGATRLDVDATSFNIEAVDINAGAADVTLKLGSRAPKTSVSLNTGASSVKIFVPALSGCRVHATAPLSLKDFRSFAKMGSGWYETENFVSASPQVEIEIHSGVSSIRIVRY